MQTPDFSRLSLLPDAASSTLRHWVLTVVATLAVSGLAPLVLLAGRGSSLADKEVVKSTFHDALVVHVDLSAVAWFLGACLLFWALLTHRRPSPVPYLRGASVGSFGVGCAFIALSPLLHDGQPLMSNYIPVYTSALFFLGLGLLAASLVLGIVDAALSARLPEAAPHERAVSFGIIGSAYIVLLALGHFYWTYARLPVPHAGTQDYYEMLFWAGGHILQLAYTQLVLVAWLVLASASGLQLSIRPAVLWGLFLIYPLVATASPIAFLNGSQPYDLYFFTMQMRHGGGLAAGLLGIYLLYKLFRHGWPSRDRLAIWTVFVTSGVLFASGGIIAFMIEGTNTIIPGHYHGSIVGMTLAFMGFIYLLLPRIGFGDVLQRKLTIAQPLLYGGGSLIHAVGFAVAGSYGTQRKTVGGMEDMGAAATAAMKFARHGGSLAIIGGALFVALVVISYRNRNTSTPA